MYDIFFSKALFDIDYGFENLNPNNECKELKKLYKCSRDNLYENNEILKATIKEYISRNKALIEYKNRKNTFDREKEYKKLPFYLQKYIDWIWSDSRYTEIFFAIDTTYS